MKTLQDILFIKDKIKAIANIFGFENIRICVLHDVSRLSFVVDRKNNETINDNDSFLSSMLAIYLNCPVTILVSSKIKSFFKESVFANSASLDNEAEIRALFNNIEPRDIKFLELTLDMDMESLQGLAEIGEKVYKDLTGNSINSYSFWLNNKQNDSQLNEEEEKCKNILSMFQSLKPEAQQKVRELINSNPKLISSQFDLKSI